MISLSKKSKQQPKEKSNKELQFDQFVDINNGSDKSQTLKLVKIRKQKKNQILLVKKNQNDEGKIIAIEDL